MDQPPRDPHERLLNRHVLVKAFLWYGLMASIAAMAGYLVVNLLNGWVPACPSSVWAMTPTPSTSKRRP